MQNLKLNFEKAKFKLRTVPFIGHEISQNKLKPDPSKIEPVSKMKEPEDAKGIQRILSVVNYLAK